MHGSPEALAEAIRSRVELPPGSGRARTKRLAGGGQRSCTKICASSPSEKSALPTRAPHANKAQPRATTAVTRTTLLNFGCCLRGHGAAGTWRARFTMPGDRSSAGAAAPFCGVRMGAKAPTVRSGARAPNTGHAVRGRNSEASRPVSMALGRTAPGRDRWDACCCFQVIRVVWHFSQWAHGLCTVRSGRNT